MMGTVVVAFKGKHRFVQHCDFCGTPESEAKILVSSPNGKHICDECVDTCAMVVAEAKESQ